MNHVVIGIPTYKRPAMLEKLLKSIDANNIAEELISKIDIVVVDNDMEKSAESVVSKYNGDKNNEHMVHYFCYPKKGLSNVRNEILIHSHKLNPDFIITIDDDEYADENWLNEMVKKCIEKSCDIVIGTVVPVFETDVKTYISHWFPVISYPENLPMNAMKSGNTLFSAKFISDNKLYFDNRFNSSGGEDTFFGMQAIDKGAEIFFAKKAVVYETIPKDRSTLNWLVKRRFRGATTYSYCHLIQRNYKVLFKKFLVSIIYIIIGILTLPLILAPFTMRYWGLLKLMDGIGGIYGMMGKTFKEYA